MKFGDRVKLNSHAPSQYPGFTKTSIGIVTTCDPRTIGANSFARVHWSQGGYETFVREDFLELVPDPRDARIAELEAELNQVRHERDHFKSTRLTLLRAAWAFNGRYHNKMIDARMIFGDVAEKIKAAIDECEVPLATTQERKP